MELIGRLVLRVKNNFMEKSKTEFIIIKNGPLHVKGNFTLKGTDGKLIDVVDEVYLCRCGASKNKPFCDGSHKTHGVND